MKRYNSIVLVVLTTLAILAAPQQTMTFRTSVPTFVFDLNGVLFDTDAMTVLRQLGMKDVLWYLARYRSPGMIKIRFYETLHRIAQTTTNTCGMKDPDGSIMPQLMVDWLRGTHANSVLLNRITTAINDNPHWFSSATEQRLMAGMARAIFDPEKFVASRKLLSDLAPLIIHLKQQGAQLYILSNWDKESFELLKKRFPYVFQWFDGHIISGKVGHVKPESAIYADVMHETSQTPFCFLDDQQENLDASKKIGWHTILVNKKTSYFGLTSKIDADAVKKNALLFLETHMVPIKVDIQKVEPSLPEQTHVTH